VSSPGRVRAVLRSQYPGLRAIEALAAAIPLFSLCSRGLCHAGRRSAPGVQRVPEPTDALYYTITVFSTVGFGDIVPVTDGAWVATMVRMVGDLLVVGLVLRVMLGAVTAARRRRAAAAAGFPDSTRQGHAGPASNP
jgi:voltage-gated potassium channel